MIVAKKIFSDRSVAIISPGMMFPKSTEPTQSIDPKALEDKL